MALPQVGAKVRFKDDAGVERIGTVTHSPVTEWDNTFCVEVPGWTGGHDGEFNDSRESCWYLGAAGEPTYTVLCGPQVTNGLGHIEDAIALFSTFTGEQRYEASFMLQQRFKSDIYSF